MSNDHRSGASDPGVHLASRYHWSFHAGAPLIFEPTPGFAHDRMMAALRAKVDGDREFTFPDRMITFPPGVKLRFDDPELQTRQCPYCGRKMDHQGRLIMGLLALATIMGAIAVIQFLALVDHGIIRL
jgi:hypothetical protein